MSAAHAPEARGSNSTLHAGHAGPASYPTLLIAAFACLLLGPAGSAVSGATPSPEPIQHQLRVWSDGPRPAFALSDLEGRSHGLANSAGDLVLVHFFATWCEPCREELASLRTLVEGQNVAESGPLSVIAVNVGEVPSRVRRFLEGTPVNFPVLLDSDRAVTRAWTVHALPTTFVLDRTLVPRLVVEGDLDWSREDVVAALGKVAAEAANHSSQSINREESK